MFRVRTFLCTCSKQFSQASRDFLPAVWKIPTQKPQLIVETRFLFSKYIIPQKVAAKIYKVVLTTLPENFCPKSEMNNENWFFSIGIPCIQMITWTLRKQFWVRLPVIFIKELMFFSSNSQTSYKKKHSFQKKYVRLKASFAHEACSPVNPPPQLFSHGLKVFAHIPKNFQIQFFHRIIIKCSKVGCE